MTKNAFQQLGGWEERMHGWGGEDTHMLAKMRKLSIGMCELEQYHAIHLYHDRNGGSPNLKNPRHKDNVKLCQDMKNMTPKDVADMCKRQFVTIGNPLLYSIK